MIVLGAAARGLTAGRTRSFASQLTRLQAR